MDKYQKYILEKYGIGLNFIFHRCNPIVENKLVNEGIVQYGEFDIESDSLTIKQDEDINLVEYALVFVNRIDMISNISIYKNNEWIDVDLTMENNLPTYKIIVNFNDRIEKIKFAFKNQLADDYSLSVCYQEADKEKYYAKKEQERKDNLLKTADIKVSTGVDLVNIYFQPCCDKYDYTEIQLYIPKDFVTVGGPYGPVQKPSTWSMIKKCKVDPEEFYKSINGLANGKYSFILKQYDKDNTIILETGYIEFTISKPKIHGIMPHVNRI